MVFFSCTRREMTRTNLHSRKINSWVCIYNENASPTDISKFDLAVVDADAHPDLTAIKKTNTILIGYVSLGEVGDYRWYWKHIANKSWILEKNPNWNSNMIDVRAQEWQDWLIDKIIPRILADGFDGLFLDTIDTAEYLEKYHPKHKYPGAQKRMIQLIKAIRKKFPTIYIIANRGFSMLSKIGSAIDGVVAESIFSTIEFNENQNARLRTSDEYNIETKKLLSVKKKCNLLVLTLDYVESENKLNIKNIISTSRQFGFIPYISTAKLDSVYLHTLGL